MKIATLLSEIVNNASSWQDIYNSLLKYNSPPQNISGRIFEAFCKHYFLVDASVSKEYKHVWLFTEVPLRVKEKLGLGKIDHGIDLVLEGHDGSYSVVQCKFRSDQSSNISWTKDNLANLFAEGDKADFYIVFTNASGLDKHSLTKKINRLKLITVGDLLSISSLTIQAINEYIITQKTPFLRPKQPRDYQKIAIQKITQGLESENRGQLIIPCGAGKTLISLWTKNELKSKHTLVLAPSLALLRQIKIEWASNSDYYIPYICVCSDQNIDKNADTSVVHTYEISGLVSTEPDEVSNFLSNHDESIVYSTYQSLEVVCRAAKKVSFVFDFAICDEAHKTAGSKVSKYALIHSDKNITINKRLYMTATPRITSDTLKRQANADVLKYLYDMSDTSIFGRELYKMSFMEAIERQILVDYQIIAIGVNNMEMQDAIKERMHISDSDTIAEIADNYALDKLMNKHNATHAVTFHSSIKKAQKFQKRHLTIYPDTSTLHVNGQLPTNQRSIILKEFEDSDKSIVTNSRCLTEGIDVPAIDLIYFCDPKNSKIDIVQAAGRALRRADHRKKKCGYIVIPIFHQDKETVEEAIDYSTFKNLISVIRAIGSHDERIVDEINKISSHHGEKNINTDHISISSEKKIIFLEGFHDKLKRSLFDQLLNRIRIPYKSFHETRFFSHSLKLKNKNAWALYCKNNNIPAGIPKKPDRIYKNKGWEGWGDWLGTYNKHPGDNNFLPFEKSRKYVHTLGLKSQKEWQKYAKSKEKPDFIPATPSQVYKNKGWKNWGDWLGTFVNHPGYKDCVSYKDAEKHARSLKLLSAKQWQKYWRKHKPERIPAKPHMFYKFSGWISWGVFLGTGTIQSQKKSISIATEAN